MKKLMSLALVLVMLLGLPGIALAADMGIQVIGGPEEETEPVNFDDMKIDVEAEIDGWGIIKLISFSFENYIMYDKEDSWGTYAYDSGSEADYAVLYVDIINTTLKNKNFLTDCTVKAVYDDKYEYAGFTYQYDGTDLVYNKENIFGVDPMYAGHYLIGCTLPNAVVSGKKPLQLIFTIDGNEFTYNIRK